ncbi:MAG: hypothetical protein CMD83_05050 [Gammaproteobacteria bacterium]|nr:hypothetical protein [Gammaproteobacteria bacterium]
MSEALARLGITRAAGDGPVDFASRVAEARPDLATPVTAVTSAYTAVNYAGEDPFPALADAVKAFRLRAIAS